MKISSISIGSVSPLENKGFNTNNLQKTNPAFRGILSVWDNNKSTYYKTTPEQDSFFREKYESLLEHSGEISCKLGESDSSAMREMIEKITNGNFGKSKDCEPEFSIYGKHIVDYYEQGSNDRTIRSAKLDFRNIADYKKDCLGLISEMQTIVDTMKAQVEGCDPDISSYNAIDSAEYRLRDMLKEMKEQEGKFNEAMAKPNFS